MKNFNIGHRANFWDKLIIILHLLFPVRAISRKSLFPVALFMLPLTLFARVARLSESRNSIGLHCLSSCLLIKAINRGINRLKVYEIKAKRKILFIVRGNTLILRKLFLCSMKFLTIWLVTREVSRRWRECHNSMKTVYSKFEISWRVLKAKPESANYWIVVNFTEPFGR